MSTLNLRQVKMLRLSPNFNQIRLKPSRTQSFQKTKLQSSKGQYDEKYLSVSKEIEH